jgi:hypothetical protein
MKYGRLPVDCGKVDVHNDEMMFWQYLPISVIGMDSVRLPENLMWTAPIIGYAVGYEGLDACIDNYMYLTVKTLWVSGDYIGNRPGWHSDGFKTDDINYVWCDRAPTEFMHLHDPMTLFELPDDCKESYKVMNEQVLSAHKTYPDKHLLRLDERVIHRCPTKFEAGMRTFVKISLSKDKYDLKGNAINHELPESHWPLKDRKVERNHPQSVLNEKTC